MEVEQRADPSNAQILKNLSDRLQHLAEDTAQVGKSVSELIGLLSTSLPPAAIRDLQKLDSMQQSLLDLAHLSAALAEPHEQRSQGLEHLKMRATRTLLDAKPNDQSVTQGSIEFF